MDKKKRRAIMRKYVPVGVIVLLMIVGLLFFLLHSTNPINAGLKYLSSQKNKDISSLKKTLANREIEETQSLLDEGKIQIFDVFKDFMFLGDSRVVGFQSYGYFPVQNVMAAAGNTIMNIDEAVSTVEERQPKNIYLSYGVNDMGLNIGENEGESGYDVVYEEQIKKLLAVDPEANIYVNSIIPATPQAVAEAPRWNKVNEFNAKIKAMCEKNGWTYIDNSSLANGGNADIYQADGIHYLSDFYTVWAKNIYDQKILADASKSGESNEKE